jgi:putative transposase
MCRLPGAARAGYYAWREHPVSDRAQEGARLLRLIRASFTASHGIYGVPRVFLDLREHGETCSKCRVARLMRENAPRAFCMATAYGNLPVVKPQGLIPNLLQRQVTVSRPNEVWATDITYIRIWQGWLYLAVVLDLLAQGRRLGRQTDDASRTGSGGGVKTVRSRRPRKALIHSDQGSQYGSDAWRPFCKD